MSARITAVNLLDIDEFLSAQPENARTAARIAINDIAGRKAVPRLRRAMREEIAFPPGYLEDQQRFGVSKRATNADLSASIVARFRPTSLARFTNDSPEGARRTGGVSVRVNPSGGAKRIGGAFFVKLRRGRDTSDGFNVGLAVRLKPGQTLRGRKKGGQGVQLAPDLYLLYGPSVDQVFREVSVAESPAVADDLQREFLRQYVRISSK
jgi:hypothetical protein